MKWKTCPAGKKQSCTLKLATMDTTQLIKKYEADSVCLHSFFSGGICSSREPREVVEILARRGTETLKLIRQTHRVLYKCDLLGLLSRGNDPFAKVAYLRLCEPCERDSETVRGALFGRTVDFNTLAEVVCSCPCSELVSLKQAYQAKYNSSLEGDVSSKTNGSTKEILLALLNSRVQNSGRIEVSMAMCDAKTLYEAIASGKCVDERSIVMILAHRTTDQTKQILRSYKELYGHEFVKFLKNDKCGDFGRRVRLVVRCIQSPEKHFAKQLRRALADGDAREALIRTVATRAGNGDIKHINAAFAAKTGWTLESLVRNEFDVAGGRARSCGLAGDLLIELIRDS